MLNSNMIIWILSIFLFSSFVIAQDDDFLLGEEEEESQEEVVCIPEDLSVPSDKYVLKDDVELQVKQAYSFAREYHKNKNYKDAIPLFWKVYINDSSKYANSAVGLLAECYFYEKKLDTTLIVCYNGLERFPDNQKIHYWAGYIQNQLGKSACAVPHYEALVEANPKNVSYLSTLAFLYFKIKNEKAIEIQKKAVELAPNDPKQKDALANYLTFFGESPIKLYEDIWKKDNTNFDAGRNFAKYAIEEGQSQKAIDPLTKIIAAQATTEDYKLRAIAYENLSRYSNAIADLNAWLKMEPDNADVMLSIAVNYMSLNKFSTSNNWIGKALRTKPGYGKAYITRGELYEFMVSACQGDKVKLEDKIVYEEATKVYWQARSDLAYKSQAGTKINNLKPFVRTKEEIFMDPNVSIANSCYSFLVGSKGVQDK